MSSVSLQASKPLKVLQDDASTLRSRQRTRSGITKDARLPAKGGASQRRPLGYLTHNKAAQNASGSDTANGGMKKKKAAAKRHTLVARSNPALSVFIDKPLKNKEQPPSDVASSTETTNSNVHTVLKEPACVTSPKDALATSKGDAVLTGITATSRMDNDVVLGMQSTISALKKKLIAMSSVLSQETTKCREMERTIAYQNKKIELLISENTKLGLLYEAAMDDLRQAEEQLKRSGSQVGADQTTAIGAEYLRWFQDTFGATAATGSSHAARNTKARWAEVQQQAFDKALANRALFSGGDSDNDDHQEDYTEVMGAIGLLI